ncbi:MAG: glycerol-3-phosphate 1-O-acyltransferase [Deltaproteobacteria bacterium]|nr:glycerol-3-phosphate 1-O-acyltransferase [Deltaproteobacteria bacterium]
MVQAASAIPGELPVPPKGILRVVYLLDAASSFEEKLLRDRVACHATEPGTSVQAISIPASRRRRGVVGSELEAALAAGDDALVAPLRVAWLARGDKAEQSVPFRELLWRGDPRDPNRLHAWWIGRFARDRRRIVAGEPALASELRDRWRQRMESDAGATLGFAEFVARQAALALERAERKLRGARYKIPLFVREEILARPSFRGELSVIAGRLGREPAGVLREAERDLVEIAATHRPTMVDQVVAQFRRVITRGYPGVLQFDRDALERVRALAQHHTVVFLPTHKSNLDHCVVSVLLHDNGLPQNHTAGGANMNFFPVGPIVRRAGIFFIRRSFKDDEIYKCVLRHYIDYLVEKRFPLEWYIEGGRSRSGKLLPPRFGLLAYVVDAYRRGRAEDVVLLPISIAYDQISDVSDYTAEQRGGEKEREGLGWVVRFIRRLGRRYGHVYVRFGEEISLAKVLGTPDPSAPPNPEDRSLELQKLAFEVCVRINRATPITPISLVCLALLGHGDRALSLGELAGSLRNLVDYVRRRNLPVTEEILLETPEVLEPVLDPLVANGLLLRHEDGLEVVYGIAPEHHLAAAYYRNTVIHYFVTGAIAEVALLRAAEPDVGNRTEEFWHEALALRDLLKFEFFFPEREQFVSELRSELDRQASGFESALERGPDAISAYLAQLRPFHAHRILRPFLEAYRVVGLALARRPTETPIDEKDLLRECLALGRQHVLQRRIQRQESVSRTLFATATKLARHRGLTETGGTELALQRQRFAEELLSTIRRIDAVEALVRARQAGILD